MKNLTLDEFMIGTILGDGCIPKLEKGAKNYRWTCGHSAKQLPYLQWKVDFLKNLDLHTGNITRCASDNPRYLNTCVTYHTKSKSDPIFKTYYDMFYLRGDKILPQFTLTPKILSILYMDDGHLLSVPRKTSKAVFNLHSMSDFERKQFCKMLAEFGLKATARHSNGEVAISAYSMSQFREIVQPNLLPIFNYKLQKPIPKID